VLAHYAALVALVRDFHSPATVCAGLLPPTGVLYLLPSRAVYVPLTYHQIQNGAMASCHFCCSLVAMSLGTSAPVAAPTTLGTVLKFAWDMKGTHNDTHITDSVSGIVATLMSGNGGALPTRTATGVVMVGTGSAISSSNAGGFIAMAMPTFGGPITIEIVGTFSKFNYDSMLFSCGTHGGFEDIVFVGCAESTGELWFDVYEGGDGRYLFSGSEDHLTLGTRHHIVATASGTTMRMYIDGVLHSETTDGWEPNSVARDTCYVGKNPEVSSGYFDGEVSSLNIYTGAFTPEQVAEAYVAEWSAAPTAAPTLLTLPPSAAPTSTQVTAAPTSPPTPPTTTAVPSPAPTATPDLAPTATPALSPPTAAAGPNISTVTGSAQENANAGDTVQADFVWITILGGALLALLLACALILAIGMLVVVQRRSRRREEERKFDGASPVFELKDEGDLTGVPVGLAMMPGTNTMFFAASSPAQTFGTMPNFDFELNASAPGTSADVHCPSAAGDRRVYGALPVFHRDPDLKDTRSALHGPGADEDVSMFSELPDVQLAADSLQRRGAQPNLRINSNAPGTGTDVNCPAAAGRSTRLELLRAASGVSLAASAHTTARGRTIHSRAQDGLVRNLAPRREISIAARAVEGEVRHVTPRREISITACATEGEITHLTQRREISIAAFVEVPEEEEEETAPVAAFNPLRERSFLAKRGSGRLPAGRDWQIHYDGGGNAYYHNAATGETQWNAPQLGS
jgi:hypothetical protein